MLFSQVSAGRRSGALADQMEPGLGERLADLFDLGMVTGFQTQLRKQLVMVMEVSARS